MIYISLDVINKAGCSLLPRFMLILTLILLTWDGLSKEVCTSFANTPHCPREYDSSCWSALTHVLVWTGREVTEWTKVKKPSARNTKHDEAVPVYIVLENRSYNEWNCLGDHNSTSYFVVDTLYMQMEWATSNRAQNEQVPNSYNISSIQSNPTVHTTTSSTARAVRAFGPRTFQGWDRPSTTNEPAHSQVRCLLPNWFLDLGTH